MTNENLRLEIVQERRAILQEYGKYYGRRIYKVKKANVDKKFNESKNAGKPSLMKPILMFVPEAIDISSITLEPTDGAGEPCVIFNNDPNLKFPVQRPDFRDVTVKTVVDALESEQPIFFCDIEKLTRELNSLNRIEFNKATDLAETFSRQAAFLSELCQKNEFEAKTYLKQLADAEADEETVTVHSSITIES